MSGTPKKQNTGGAPKANRNAMRHGLKAGQLPKGCKYIENRLNAFRRQLEDACLAAKGQVSLSDAANINTAVRWERHASLAHRWLTKQFAKLKPAEQLNFSREIATASAKRDAAIEMLELDQEQMDVFETLYATTLPAPESE